jgi:hypothetical protein
MDTTTATGLAAEIARRWVKPITAMIVAPAAPG